MGSSHSQEDAPGADDTSQDYQQAAAPAPAPASNAIVPADASMHVQDPTLQQRLVGDTPGGLGSLRAQCAYGAAESHFMLFAMVPCASGDRKAASQRWREHRRCVVYNPCYWCCWLPTMLLIVVGRWLHYLFGQHNPLREPEHELEHEVRVWWIYPSDAAFLGGPFLVVAEAIWHAAEGTFTHYYHWTALIVTVSIYLGYILSNVLFLHAMRIQSAIHTKAFIAGNAALALTLAAVGVTLAVRVANGDVPESIAFKEKGQSWLRIIGTWAVRVGFVLFLLFMTWTYMRLWFLYDHDEVRLSRILTAHDAEAPPPADAADAAPARPRQMTVRTRQRAVRWHFCTLAAAFATSAIVAGLLVAAGLLNVDALWEALA